MTVAFLPWGRPRVAVVVNSSTWCSFSNLCPTVPPLEDRPVSIVQCYTLVGGWRTIAARRTFMASGWVPPRGPVV